MAAQTEYRITALGKKEAESEVKPKDQQLHVLQCFLKRLRWISNPGFITASGIAEDAKNTVSVLDKLFVQLERLNMADTIWVAVESRAFAQYMQSSTNTASVLQECCKRGWAETRETALADKLSEIRLV